MKKLKKATLKVPKSQTGVKLVHYLNQNFSFGTRETKRLLEQRHCSLNGKIETFASYKLKGGEIISFTLPEKNSEPTRLTIKEKSILYEDKAILIYDKPAGYPSAPTEDLKRINLFKLLSAFLYKRDQTSLWMVHRLDRDTSGVLMFVKQEELVEVFSDLFRERQIKKIYEAIVDGALTPKEGKMISYLELKSKQKGWERWGSTKGEAGKYAETGYQVLQNWSDASYVRLAPKTGRIHQLRVHLSEKKHPILGDHFYGKNFLCKLAPKRHLLHAKSLAFVHPLTQKQLKIDSKLPEDFQEAIRLFSRKSR